MFLKDYQLSNCIISSDLPFLVRAFKNLTVSLFSILPKKYTVDIPEVTINLNSSKDGMEVEMSVDPVRSWSFAPKRVSMTAEISCSPIILRLNP